MIANLKAELDPLSIRIIVDTREQRPFEDLHVQTDNGPVAVPTIVGTLPTGDYSVHGWTDEIVVERKSLEDLISCVGSGRERFEAELVRMRAYPSRVVVVESSWAQLLFGGWRGKVTPRSAAGSVTRWIERGIPFFFAGSRQDAGLFTADFLYKAAALRYRRLYERFKDQLNEKKEAG